MKRKRLAVFKGKHLSAKNRYSGQLKWLSQELSGSSKIVKTFENEDEPGSGLDVLTFNVCKMEKTL
jgi:hypothetical protein